MWCITTPAHVCRNGSAAADIEIRGRTGGKGGGGGEHATSHLSVPARHDPATEVPFVERANQAESIFLTIKIALCGCRCGCGCGCIPLRMGWMRASYYEKRRRDAERERESPRINEPHAHIITPQKQAETIRKQKKSNRTLKEVEQETYHISQG